MGYIFHGICITAIVVIGIVAMRFHTGKPWQPRWFPMDLQQLLQLERGEKTASSHGSQLENCYIDTTKNPETVKTTDTQGD